MYLRSLCGICLEFHIATFQPALGMRIVTHACPPQAAKCKWRALRHTCLLLLSVLGGMPASHQGMQARLFFCGGGGVVMYTEKS